MNNYNGKLIAIEGIDASGTTTLANNIQQRSEIDAFRNGVSDEWIFTKEPSDGLYGSSVRESLSGGEATPADFFGFLADRYEHMDNVIEPALKEGKYVVTDRYDLSTYAYQSKVLDEELDIMRPTEYIEEMTYHFTIEPDLYIYLDLSVDKVFERMGDGSKEKYEVEDRLKEARRIYNYMVEKKDNAVTIPAAWDEEGVLDEAWLSICNL